MKMDKLLIERAKVEINSIVSAYSIIRCVILGSYTYYEEASKRGVKIQWIAPIDTKNIIEARKLCESGQVRNLNILDSVRFKVIDGCETLISSIYDDSLSIKSEGDVTIWTNDKNISRTINYFFYHLWDDAKPIRKTI